MEDTLKKILYGGIGAAAGAVKKLQEVVDDIVENQDSHKEDGKRIITEIKKNFDKTKSEAETKINEVFKSTVDKVKQTTNSSQVEDLQKKVKYYEAQMKHNKFTAKNKAKKGGLNW